jgi:hypothetical protein
MGGLTVAKVVVAIVALGILWIGIGFAGYAVTAAFIPFVGLAAAAAIAAVVLIALSGILVLIAKPHAVKLAVPGKEQQQQGDMAMLAALSSVAKEKPLLAVLSAGLFGAADVLLKDRK